MCGRLATGDRHLRAIHDVGIERVPNESRVRRIGPIPVIQHRAFSLSPIPHPQKSDVRDIRFSPDSDQLEHDPEKWKPVFPRDKRGTRLRGDHAQTKS